MNTNRYRMNGKIGRLFAAIISAVVSYSSVAVGETLHIYNYTEYINPELVTKFEKETGIKVVLDTYDTNETLLAKLQSGAAGYDIAVAAQNFVPILIAQGLIQSVAVKKLSNYQNINEKW